MKKSLSALLALAISSGITPVMAAGGEDLLRDCEGADDVAWCRSMQDGVVEDFDKALKGDYQAQRNLAYCLSTGCDGATVVDVDTGCAWRIIILAAADPAMDASDAANFQNECGRLGSAGLKRAMTLAKARFRSIYGRKMPDF